MRPENIYHPCVCVYTQSCLRGPIDCSPPGSSVHGVFQARVLERVAMSSSQGSCLTHRLNLVFSIAGRFFTTELPEKPGERV